MGALGEVVAPAAAPDENVVGQVTRDLVALLGGPSEDLPQERNVLVVPGIPVGDGGPVADSGDLVAVVPPIII